MKKLYFLLPLILLFCFPAFAKIFRVGYNGTPLIGVDYSDINQANDAATNGDTIQIYGIQGANVIQTINKRLVILGFGYNLKAHTGLQSNPGVVGNEIDNPSYAAIYLDPGSDSSIIEGIIGTLIVGANKVTIRRCGGGSIFIRDDLALIQDLRIYSCYQVSVKPYTSGFGGIHKFPSKNIQMYNCLYGYFTLLGSESTGFITNCTFVAPILNDKLTILYKNSIIDLSSPGGSFSDNLNTIYENNIFINLIEPNPTLPGSNNKYAQVPDSVFVTQNPDPIIGSLDENNYQLRPNSPAKNFGIDLSGNPTDCGIFGGELAYRYKIGGQPAIPAFYKLSAPNSAATTNPYNITVSIKSNN